MNSKRSVRFSGDDVTISYPLSQEQASTWMTPQEFDLIKQDLKSTVILMRKGDRRANITSEVYNTRGLECLTLEGMRSKKRRRTESLRAVFYEQYRQFETDNCIYDPESLSIKYMNETKLSKLTARVVGMMDAKHEAPNLISIGYPVHPPKFDVARSEEFEHMIRVP